MKKNDRNHTPKKPNGKSDDGVTSKKSDEISSDQVDHESGLQKKPARTRLWVVLAGVGILIVAVAFAGRWSLAAYSKSLARNHVSKFQYTDALSWIEFAEQLGVADYELYFLKARIYRKTGKFDLFESAIAKSRELGLPEQTMKNEKLLLQGQSGKLSELLANLEQLAGGVDQFDPSEIYEAVVNGFLLVGRFNDAAEFIVRWEKDFPDDPNQKFLKATLLIQHGPAAGLQGSQENAVELLDYVTTNYPDHYQAMMTYGDLLLESNKIEDALKKYEACESIEQVQVKARLQIGECLARLGRQSDAKEYYRKILDDEPQNVDALAELGKLQFNDEEYEDALRNLEKAYSQRNWDFDLANSLARVLQLFEREKEAERLFARSQQIREKLSDIQDLKLEVDTGGGIDQRIELGKLLLEFGDPQLGILYLRGALDIDPSNATAKRLLAEFFDKQKMKNPSFGD